MPRKRQKQEEEETIQQVTDDHRGQSEEASVEPTDVRKEVAAQTEAPSEPKPREPKETAGIVTKAFPDAEAEQVEGVSEAAVTPAQPQEEAAGEHREEVPEALTSGMAERRAPSLWPAALMSAALAFIFAVLVTLGILLALNGSLVFARPTDVLALHRQVQSLDTRLVQLQGRIETLQNQVDALQGLDARVKALDTQVQQVRQDVQALQGDVQAMQQTVAQLQAAQARYERFFLGLQELLQRVFGGSTVPTPTPTPAP